jgi:hypothetical protein
VIQVTIHRKHSKYTKFVQDGFGIPLALFDSIFTEGESETAKEEHHGPI